MHILCIGDVVGENGCRYLRKILPNLKRVNAVDVCIANGENSAKGNGITPYSADFLLSSGVDAITSGNHVFRRPEIYDYFSDNKPLIRPANYRDTAPGKGYVILDKGFVQIAVINVLGTVYMENLYNPFDTVDELLQNEEISSCKIKLLDFHAEATSEKRAMGYYVDGRITAIFGTHTHVPTADACLLPKGTAYITDLGMTGPTESVLGVEINKVIEKFRTNMPVRFGNPDTECKLEGIILDVDQKTGLAVSIEQIFA